MDSPPSNQRSSPGDGEDSSDPTDPRFERLTELFGRLGPDPDENIEILVDETKSLLDASFSLYHRVDRRADEFYVVAARGLPPQHPDRSDAEGQICYDMTMRNPDGLAVVGDLQSSQWADRYPDFGAYLGTALEVDGEVVGSLCAMDRRSRDFSSVDRRLFSALGTALALEEERRQESNRVERLNEVLRSIRRVSQLLIREHDRGRIWQGGCEILVDNASFVSAHILTRDENGDLRVDAAAPASATSGPPFRDVPVRTEIDAALDGDIEVLTWNPVRTGGAHSPDVADSPARYVGATLEYSGLIYGLLILGSNHKEAHSHERTLLKEVADELAFVTHALTRESGEDHLAEQALRDWLTGLPNRTLFHSRLEHVISRTERRDRSFALLFIDLDGLKDVNDSLGHAAGDRLLVEFAERLEQTAREEDTVARIGGDEFTVILEDLRPQTDLDGFLERLESTIDVPFEIDGERVHASASIGVVHYERLKARLDRDHLSDEDLLRAADQAMYRAKDRAATEWSTVQSADLEDRQEIQRANALRTAIDDGNLTSHFHPIVDLDGEELHALEALARWEHPRRGVIPAGEFVSLAESRGFLWHLSRSVYRDALRAFERWSGQLDHDRPPHLYLNLSPASFEEEAFLHFFDDFEVQPRHITFEITEQALVRNPDRIDRLADEGFRIAVDDFGTGYSSFEYLKNLAIDVLKLDLSFVQGAPDNSTDRAIVEMVCGLGANLDLPVIAEGVETDAQRQIVRAVGCQCAQGYLYEHPLTADEVETYLDDIE